MAAAIGANIGLTGPAAADTPVRYTADIVAEVQYENTVGPSETAPHSDFLFTTIEAGLSLGLSDRLAIESVVLVEILDDPLPGQNSTFEDHGLFAEELMLAYHGDSWSLHAGKFNTAFGTGWDISAGIWGVDFPEDYEVAEKVGMAATKTFGNEDTGQHTLYGSLYRADRSILSESLFENRGRLELADGGATNTKDFESFTLSLTGETVFGTDGLGYQLAYRSHAPGDVNIAAEREDGFAASVFGIIPLGSLEIEAMTEAVYAKNADGGLDDVSYLTVGGTTYYANAWNTALSVTFRTTHVPGGADVKDHRFQATTGYVWESGVSLDFGYRYSRESGDNNHALGFLLGYAFSL